MLLDEPFSALDYQTRLKVGDDIGSIIKKSRKTAILVTHDLSEAVSLGDRILVLSPLPAKIKTIIPTEFPKELSPFERRNTSEFQTYFNQIWKELNPNEPQP
jgi:NitT/TauT family transport system ATP-binding protein